MADKSLAELAEKMKDIDFAILSTRTASEAIAARPMSNDRQVDFDGDRWFFTCDDTGSVADIEGDPQAGLAYQSKSGMLGMRPFFLTLEGPRPADPRQGPFRRALDQGPRPLVRAGNRRSGPDPDQGDGRAAPLSGRL